MLRATSRLGQFTIALGLALVVSLSAMDIADARRAGGGGFGSRGSKTYQAPAPTRTAPNTAAPIERSMTPNTGAQTRPAQGVAAANAAKPGFFNNFGRSMLGGLLVGGLIGMLLGNGLGGMAGFLGLILQVALFAGLAMLAMRFFANRNKPATAAAGAGSARTAQNFGNQFGKRDAQAQNTNARSSTSVPSAGFGAGAGASASAAAANMMQPAVEEKPLTVSQEDLEHFEKMLTEVQTAYGQENYGTLRQLATPEAMSYLAEELGENATNGLRNHVSEVKLLQGDVSEGWSEEGKDYATVAMRYESIDYMADRDTGELAEGESTDISESVEVWTFVRPANGRIEDWKLSAIQAA
ncbi:Tim44 domain-containing protein [Bacillus subtilis]|uniref:Tim44 domain-containing protein n=1 Tax=Pseudochrobactrum asaccharolyticum TaxID=354351 RepID=UPI001F479E85|nr:Tim44 domain-containing protein [Pseudochrobactrum asaccharolyticum]MCF7645494.1 Tim44 domain-containing protein [Pseudochrobactrum asaccharolyticum]MCF7672109.1 Tim44 domain-containing protein [Bacillus subtilis]